MRVRTAAGVGIAAMVAVVAALWTCAGEDEPPPTAPSRDAAGDRETTRERKPRDRARAGTGVEPLAAEEAPPAPPPAAPRPSDGVQIVRLTDPDGRPLAGAYVEVQGDRLSQRWASADANGVATISGLADEPLVVRVRPASGAQEAVRVLRRPGPLALAWRRLEVRPRFPEVVEQIPGEPRRSVKLGWSRRRSEHPRTASVYRPGDTWTAVVPPDPGWVTVSRGFLSRSEWLPLRIGPVEPGAAPVEFDLDLGTRIEGRIAGTRTDGQGDLPWCVVLVNERKGADPSFVEFACGEILRSPPVPRGSTWTLVAIPRDADGEFAVVPGVVAPAAERVVTTSPGRRVRIRVEVPPEAEPTSLVEIRCWPARVDEHAATGIRTTLAGAATPAVLRGPAETLALAAGDDGPTLHSAATLLVAPSEEEVVLRLTPTPLVRGTLRFADGTPVTMGRIRLEPLPSSERERVVWPQTPAADGSVQVALPRHGRGLETGLHEDGRFTFQVLPGRRRLTWTWFNDVEIDLGEVDVPAAGDVVLTLPTADR